MKPTYFFTGILAVVAMAISSCSTPNLANRTAMPDDVYATTAQAKEYGTYPVIVDDTTSYAENQVDYYGKSDPYYDMDYSSRINRFYYASPWRSYFDGYYGLSPYDYSYYYNPYELRLGLGHDYIFNYWNSPYSSWAFYGSPYRHNYWGYYSYYRPFPYYYGGGYYGGGYLGGGYLGGGYLGNYVSSRPNTPRPSRGSENGINRNNNPAYPNRPNTTSAGRSRAELYNPNRNGTTTGNRNNGTSNGPDRANTSSNARPTRGNDVPPPRPSYTPPPSTSNSGSSSSGRSGSSGSSSGSSRPTRGGGR